MDLYANMWSLPSLARDHWEQNNAKEKQHLLFSPLSHDAFLAVPPEDEVLSTGFCTEIFLKGI